MKFLEVKNISHDLEDFSLKNISFSLDKGDFLTLIGPSGAGKSVLIKSILGFFQLKSGEIFLNDKKISALRTERRNISIVYQSSNLFPHLNVYKNLAYGLKRKLKDNELIRKKIEILAADIGIDHLLKRKTDKLSGGEKQRTAIARALLVEPELLLMDEPFSALDSLSRKCLRNILKDISKKFKTTVIEVTHNLNDAWILADKVGFIQDGELKQFGDFEDIFKRPNHKFIANFVNTSLFSAKVLENSKDLTKLDVNGTTIFTKDKAPKGSKVEIAIRPEDIIILKEKSDYLKVENCLPCRLKNIVDKGIYSLVIAGDENNKYISDVKKSLLSTLNVKLNQEIFCFIKADSVKILK